MREEWRCTRCRGLLAMVAGNRLHIRIGRSSEYTSNLPATAICRKCGTLNERDEGSMAN